MSLSSSQISSFKGAPYGFWVGDSFTQNKFSMGFAVIANNQNSKQILRFLNIYTENLTACNFTQGKTKQISLWEETSKDHLLCVSLVTIAIKKV